MGALKKLKFPSGHSVLEVQVNQPDGRSLALPITFIGTGSFLVTPTSISELVLQFLTGLSSAGLNFISSHLLPDPHLIDKKCCYLVYSNSETKPAI